MRGPSGVASDNLQDSNHRRLGASAEGRLAWPQAPSPSGHLCKPTRPQGPRIAFRRAPVAPTDTHPHRPETRSRKLPRNSCPSSRNRCCSQPIGHCRAGRSPACDTRRVESAGIRARARRSPLAPGSEAASSTRRGRAARDAFRHSGRARAAGSPLAHRASGSNNCDAEPGLPTDRSRRRSTARSSPCFFGLV